MHLEKKTFEVFPALFVIYCVRKKFESGYVRRNNDAWHPKTNVTLGHLMCSFDSIYQQVFLEYTNVSVHKTTICFIYIKIVL